MNIGEAAIRSGLNNKTIRYYESLDLIRPKRLANGYRTYSEGDTQQLRFLQRARAVGFSLEECRELLELYRNPGRRSAEVKTLVLDRVAQVDNQLSELEAMRETLMTMANHCAGDDQAECAIIDSLSQPKFKLV